MSKERQNKTKKISWKKLLAKAIEEGLKTGLELAILAIMLGAATKLILLTVPIVTVSALTARFTIMKFVG